MSSFSHLFSSNEPARAPEGAELMLFGRRRGFFGEENLLRLVAFVTLLLQAISFITTLQGATVFLGGIFVLAPLFFALAVQATAWFLAGSLRVRITPLRCVALGMALCCSTYYSYVGIYNTVNPPAMYLSAEYAQVRSELDGAYAARRTQAFRTAQDQINAMVSGLAGQYSLLEQESARLAACAKELEEAGAEYSGGLRAPSRSSYANYEDYVAAYNAYLASVTENSSAEQAAARQAILARYGFDSESALAGATAQNASDLSAFEAAAAELGGEGETVAAQLESARAFLLDALTAAEAESTLSSDARAALGRLVQLASAQTGSTLSTDDLLRPVDAAMTGSGEGLMASFDELAAQLEGGRVTRANAQEMKTLLTSEILNAVLRVNEVADEEVLQADDPALQITDLHLKPLLALTAPAQRGMALFCLFLAALMDGLTLVFSIACRRRPTLLKARSPRRLLAENGDALAAQVCACLPAGRDPMDELELFLSRFSASPDTLAEGYSLAAPRQELTAYERLCALLCQAGLASIRPAGENGADGEAVLLRSDFLLFANELLTTRSRGRLASDLAAEAAASRRAAALGQTV
ncbi:hypothetical protein [Candidatus Allofournierella excrementigallinarum]|uniref:hypothetical protein n=1 Tax=Candidatus Allofournierella excrementigallinarum TaxID=2838592 RepID=UPI00374F8335